MTQRGDVDLSARPGASQGSRWRELAALLVPAFGVAIVVLIVLDPQQQYPAHYLRLALSTVFRTLLPLFVAYLLARSFLSRGNPGMLLLTWGVLTWAIAALMATIIPGAPPNATITIYNTLVALSAVGHLTGAVLVIWPPRPMRAAGLWLAAAILGTAGLAATITVASIAGWMPAFFIEGQGGTRLREVVLTAAITLFATTALLLWGADRHKRSGFCVWYALALLMLALGLLGVKQAAYDSVLSWAGRGVQFISGLYMLMAAMVAIRETHALRVPIEAALQEAQNRYSSLVQTSPEAIVVVRDAVAVFMNPAAVELIGAAQPEEILGREALSLFHPDDRQEAADRLRRAFEGQLLPIQRIRLLRLDGGCVEVETVGSRILFDGQPAVQVVARDITAREQAQKALRDSERRFRLVVENSRDGIHQFDIQTGRYVFISPAQARLTGFSPDELTEMSLDEVMAHAHPEDRASLRSYLDRVIAGDAFEMLMEYRWRVKSGDYRWFSDSRGLIRDDRGHPECIVGVTRDITAYKSSQEALAQAKADLEQRVARRTAELRRRADQLARLTSELTLTEQRERRRLAQVLHDHLQQLLVGAKFGMSALRRRADDGLQEAVNHVEALIDESIQASRSLTVELSPPILHEAGLAAGLEWLARWVADKHGLRVELHLDQEVTPDREDVKLLLFQSVRELLLNVVKHARVTEAAIQLAVEDDGQLCLRVSDRGAGFEPDEFASHLRLGRGGFGLFSIQERLATLGGRLKIDSRLGDGACFTLIVPMYESRQYESESQLLQASDPSKLPAATGHPEPSGPKGRIRVLVVDDHDVVRQGLCSLLMEEDDAIEVVGEGSDGREALEQARRLHPDIVLMDYSMPEMDGVEATRRIREELPLVKVIGLSMYEEQDRAAAVLQAGAAAYLTKSGDVEGLLVTIHRVHATGDAPDQCAKSQWSA